MKNLALYSLLLFFTLSCKAQEHQNEVYTYKTKMSKEAKNASIAYTVSTPKPETHFAEVTLKIDNYKKDYIDFKLPVWAPGSYLVREFSRFIEDFNAKSGDTELKWEKISKNTWRVFSNKASNITVSYSVYCYELSVRTSFVDDSHAYFNGTSVFMYVDDLLQKDGDLKIIPYKDFKKVATALPKKDNQWNYSFTNYDFLVDCPIEIGNHEEFEFTAGGTLHKVAMYGKGNYDIETLRKDMAAVCQSATDVFGDNPNKEYTFIIHNLTNGSGGLEHLNSTTLQVNRWTYDGGSYKGFLSLVAHEYFHLWNVKRIRPEALGPFDYENENYTHLLWVMEGFTSYYENVILYRAGILSGDDLINKMKSKISYIENAPGGKVQSATESSWDAWIKAYRPHENSGNVTISYYSKGAVLAYMLDLQIIENTKGEKTLDDVMKLLWNKYAKELKRGFTDTEFQKAVEEIAGKSLDTFFKNHIFDAQTVDYAKFFDFIGIKYTTLADEVTPKLSASLRGNTISSITAGGSAYESGLNVNDEIIAINEYRVDNNISDILSEYKVGDKVEVLIARDNIMKTIQLELLPSTSSTIILEAQSELSDAQKTNLKAWLKK